MSERLTPEDIYQLLVDFEDHLKGKDWQETINAAIEIHLRTWGFFHYCRTFGEFIMFATDHHSDMDATVVKSVVTMDTSPMDPKWRGRNSSYVYNDWSHIFNGLISDSDQHVLQ